RYTALVPKLGTSDRMTIQQHLDKIRQMKIKLLSTAMGSTNCKAPTKIDTTSYNPGAGACGTMCAGANTGSILDITTDKMIPTVGTYMMDMMVMALACDLTAVETLQ